MAGRAGLQTAKPAAMERRAKPGASALGKASLMRTDQSEAAGIRNQSCCARQMRKVGDVAVAAAEDT